MDFGHLYTFNDVFKGERDSVNEWRKANERPEFKLEEEKLGKTELTASDGTTPLRPTDDSNVIGLSLSGGGIRSAAFCLGVLQALNASKILRNIDYLSTVSGGGYIGSSLSAGMTASGGHFPFQSYLSEDETPSLQHVRDYSNYLFPKGAVDFLHNASIYTRGLVANVVLVLPFLLLAAALTILVYSLIGFTYFAGTICLTVLLFAFTIRWAIERSKPESDVAVEIPNSWTTNIGRLILVVFLVAFCELQPFILSVTLAADQTKLLPTLIMWVKRIVLVLTPLATIIAFVGEKFGSVIKGALESERIRDKMFGFAAKSAVYVAALVVPLLLWLLYLQLSYWGFRPPMQAVGHAALAKVAAVFSAGWLSGWGTYIIVALYILLAAACFILTFWMRPNANSLHPLYRDRLSKAFLFEPLKTVPRDPDTGVQRPLEALHPKLSDLSDADSPYHLINTALNVQGSKQVNRRGRNADFFIFSKRFVGSKATDYVATADMQEVMPGLNLGTAMATSGAAASSNMGAATIKPLTPTLALLNIRLGYWLRNPRRVAQRGSWNWRANFYFLLEMFGRLDETRRSIYLTDGGHIENLGIYELLRRRCKVIIAVDAEADPQMAFGSFNVLERYALIDLGVRIDLPWQQVADVSKATSEAIDEKGNADKKHGPHVAIGEIGYPGNRKGILIYIKSSLTGDENDYVFHYKRRYAAFPHETTLDQFFSEEQFEAYRALGFHATYRFFSRTDDFAHRDPNENSCIRDHLAFLDTLFPLPPKPDPCWPQPNSSFVDWLNADAAAAAADDTAKKAAAASSAVVADAAKRIATAAETAAKAAAKRKNRRRAGQ